MKHTHEHNDPSRIPHLQLPIEDSMVNIHKKGFGKLLLDVTKALVKAKK
jgi:hypothetical protein